jgi:hypothetical protein
VRRIAVAVLALIASGACLAQLCSSLPFAGEDDIPGAWEIAPVPTELQPKYFDKDPWPWKCQWYLYAKDGVLKSFERFGPNVTCERMSAADLQKGLEAAPPVQHWRFLRNDAGNKTAVVVTRTDVPNHTEFWEVHVVTSPMVQYGVTFDKGDLLLCLADLKLQKLVYVRHLRKL